MLNAVRAECAASLRGTARQEEERKREIEGGKERGLEMEATACVACIKQATAACCTRDKQALLPNCFRDQHRSACAASKRIDTTRERVGEGKRQIDRERRGEKGSRNYQELILRNLAKSFTFTAHLCSRAHPLSVIIPSHVF